MKNWIPKFIRKNLAYRQQDIVSASDYNAVLNLLISQGDYNSEWLEWLTSEGLAEFFKDLNGEDIKQMIVQAAEEQIAALASASANKTSAHLNNPTFTIFDESATVSTRQLLKPVLDDYGVPGTVSCYSSLVGMGNPHMAVEDLQMLQANGYAVINHGTDKAALTDDVLESVLSQSSSFMRVHNLITGEGVFAYNSNSTITEDTHTIVSKTYAHAIGKDIGVNDTDNYAPYWLKIIPITEGVDAVRKAVEDTLKHNYWCIFTLDSSEASFETDGIAVLRAALELIKNDANAKVITAPVAANLAANTINNTIKQLRNDNDKLLREVVALKQELHGLRRITHGPVSAGVPPTGNEGDIHIMYE